MGSRRFVRESTARKACISFSEGAVAPVGPRGHRTLILLIGLSPASRHSPETVHCYAEPHRPRREGFLARDLRAHSTKPCLLEACQLGATPLILQASPLPPLPRWSQLTESCASCPAMMCATTSPPNPSPHSNTFPSSAEKF